jgi:hypothetical protein
MQVKLKAIALAVSVSFTGAAHAIIDNYSAPGNSVSYTKDLDPIASRPNMGTFNMNDFLPAGTSAALTANSITPLTQIGSAQAPGTVEQAGTQFQWSIGVAGDTAWQSFLSGASNSPGNWKWGVYAGDKTGSFGAQHQVRYLTTGTNLTEVAATSSSAGTGQMSVTEAHVDYANSQTGATPDGSFYGTAANDGLAGYSGTGFGNDWQGKVPFVATGNVGDSLNFFYITGRPGAAPIAQFGNAGGASKWKFAGTPGTGFGLEYVAAPVPEAETWAMFVAGLLGVGAIARRRMAA